MLFLKVSLLSNYKFQPKSDAYNGYAVLQQSLNIYELNSVTENETARAYTKE